MGRIVDVMEELMKSPCWTRTAVAYLTDRYSERKESAEEADQRVIKRLSEDHHVNTGINRT